MSRELEPSPAHERHHHQRVDPHTGHTASTVLLWTIGLAFLSLLMVGVVHAGPQVTIAGIVLLYLSLVLVPLLWLGIVGYLLWHRHHLAQITRRHAAADLEAKENEERRDQEMHEMRLYLAQTRLLPDGLGNRPYILNPRTYEVIAVPGGNYVMAVPEHYAPHIHYADTGRGQAPEQHAPAPLLLPDKLLMLDVMRRWDLRSDNLFLALGKGGQEIACPLEDLMHVAHDAPTGGGKTAQFYAEIIMLLKLGVRVILANPHFAPVGKRGEDWRPIGRAIEAQGMIEIAPGVRVPGLIRNYASITNVLRWLAEHEIDRRYQMQAEGDYGYEPVYLFLDEWPAVVRRHPEAAEYQIDVLQRGRAVDVCVDTNAQGFLVEDVALKGSARENFNTAFHMGGSPYSGSKLLDMPVKDLNAVVRNDQVVLGKGVALLRNNTAVPQAQLVRLPYADNTYAYYMLGRADAWELPEFRARRTQDHVDVPDEGSAPPTPGDSREPLAGQLHDGIPAASGTTVVTLTEVPPEEREQIIRLARAKVHRRDMCTALGKGKRYYETVKRVLDEEGL